MPSTKSPTAVLYRWSGSGSFTHVPAQVVGEELARLEVKPGQFHRTKDVLESARDPKSPLHGCYLWDDEAEAELHRIQVTQGMIRSITTVHIRHEKRIVRPVYVHIRDEEGPRYVNVDRVASREELKRQAMDEAVAGLEAWRRRYQWIEELEPVFEAVRVVKKKRKTR